MLRKLFLFLLAVIVILVIVIATRPATFRVERSTSIAASPEAVFAQVNDFHNWVAWSPWEKLDPEMKRTFGGPASGKGSTYGWVGNDKVGEGKMTIEQSTPPAALGIKLEFIKPFEQSSDVKFAFSPEGAGTKVTWSMEGENNFLSKAFSLFMDMDKLVGGDFERGLASLKTTAEGAGAQKATTTK